MMIIVIIIIIIIIILVIVIIILNFSAIRLNYWETQVHMVIMDF